jgi:hypothetical protein
VGDWKLKPDGGVEFDVKVRSAVKFRVPLAAVVIVVGFAVFVTLMLGVMLLNVTTAPAFPVAVVLSSSFTIAVTVSLCVVPTFPETSLANEHE